MIGRQISSSVDSFRRIQVLHLYHLNICRNKLNTSINIHAIDYCFKGKRAYVVRNKLFSFNSSVFYSYACQGSKHRK